MVERTYKRFIRRGDIMPDRTRLTTFAMLLLVLFWTPPTDAASPEDAYAALRQAGLDGRTIAVEDVTLERDVFKIRFGNGQFHLLAPVEGRTLGAVFVGDGEYSLRPATAGEQHQATDQQEREEQIAQ